MSQYVYSIKRTPFGRFYCVAYPAVGDKAVAISRKDYTNGNDAMVDVMEQLGVRKAEPPAQPAQRFSGVRKLIAWVRSAR